MQLVRRNTRTPKGQTSRPRMLVAVAVAAVGLALATPGPAAARPSDTDQRGSARTCAVVLEKATPGGTASVAGRACSTSSADAHAKASRQAGRTGVGLLASDTLLFRTYDHVSYQGYQTNFYGSYGTCDRDGYTFFVDPYWFSVGDTMSSISGFGRCDTVRLTRQETAKVGTFYLPTSSIGAWNDNVTWIHVYDR